MKIEPLQSLRQNRLFEYYVLNKTRSILLTTFTSPKEFKKDEEIYISDENGDMDNKLISQHKFISYNILFIIPLVEGDKLKFIICVDKKV